MNPGFKVFIVLIFGGGTALLSLLSAALIVIYRPEGPLLCRSRCGLQRAFLELLGQNLYSGLFVLLLLIFSAFALFACLEIVRSRGSFDTQ